MILDNYKNGVVIVYSLPRSGTTLFCKYLERKLGIPNAGEIFHDNDLKAKEVSNKVITQANKDKQDFICKYFPGIDVFDQTRFGDRSSFYRVNLIRKNIARQFTSIYIATETDVWQTNGFGRFKTDMTRKELKIDREKMQMLFDLFIKSLIGKEKTDKKTVYDEILIYEDIIDYLNENKQRDVVNIPSLKPTNYNFIYAEAINMLIAYYKKNKDIPVVLAEWYENFQVNGFKS